MLRAKLLNRRGCQTCQIRHTRAVVVLLLLLLATGNAQQGTNLPAHLPSLMTAQGTCTKPATSSTKTNQQSQHRVSVAPQGGELGKNHWGEFCITYIYAIGESTCEWRKFNSDGSINPACDLAGHKAVDCKIYVPSNKYLKPNSTKLYPLLEPVYAKLYLDQSSNKLMLSINGRPYEEVKGTCEQLGILRQMLGGAAK